MVGSIAFPRPPHKSRPRTEQGFSLKKDPLPARRTAVRIIVPSARQIARTVAPGIAPVATRQSIERDETFPSAECASTSENTEATGDPRAPLARLSAPLGQRRLAPPLREGLRSSDGCRRRRRFQGRGIGCAGQSRTLREERAGRPSAERRETGGRGSAHASAKDARGEEPAPRRRSHARGFADAGGGSGRTANGSEAEDGPQARRRDATNSTRDRQRGALRGRSGADRLPDAASWAGLRPAADLAVAARPSGRPSRPPGSGSTVAPKHAARRQATGRARQANDVDDLRRADHLFRLNPCRTGDHRAQTKR